MMKVQDVASYFLAKQDTEETGELISNLKIQKLCYYAQGFSLAINNEPLFEDPIVCWQHGPVVPNLWHLFKEYGPGPIPAPVEFDLEEFDPQHKSLLDDVYQLYGQFSAWKLRSMTHAEPCWSDTQIGKSISHKVMRDYFETLVEDDGEKAS